MPRSEQYGHAAREERLPFRRIPARDANDRPPQRRLRLDAEAPGLARPGEIVLEHGLDAIERGEAPLGGDRPHEAVVALLLGVVRRARRARKPRSDASAASERRP